MRRPVVSGALARGPAKHPVVLAGATAVGAAVWFGVRVEQGVRLLAGPGRPPTAPEESRSQH